METGTGGADREGIHSLRVVGFIVCGAVDSQQTINTKA
jgi:hypothetical protein